MWSVRATNHGRLPFVPCGWCGKRVEENANGPRRRWCSPACRMKSHRAHQRLRKPGQSVTAHGDG